MTDISDTEASVLVKDKRALLYCNPSITLRQAIGTMNQFNVTGIQCPIDRDIKCECKGRNPKAIPDFPKFGSRPKGAGD